MEDGERWGRMGATFSQNSLALRSLLVSGKKKKEDGGEEAPAPAAKVGTFGKDAHFGGAVFAVS